MPYDGTVSSGGGVTGGAAPGGGPTVSSGAINRGDGVTITYRCVGGELVEFAIRR